MLEMRFDEGVVVVENEGQRLVLAAEQRRARITPEQEARRREVDARNERIQKVGLRPADGVTFGSGKVGGKGKRGEAPS